MKKFLFIFFVSFHTLSLVAQSDEEKYFRAEYDTIVEKTFVLDFEKTFDKEQTKNLNKLISDFEKETSIEIAIITFDTKYDSDEEFHKNTLFVANWIGVGKKYLDNGIVIEISNTSRKIRIENGNGIELILSDQETKEIIDNEFIPNFENKEFYRGTFNGVLKIIEVLREKLKHK
ncbi:TPM domain-containing protein [Flavobacterium sp.]|uniref:TPM domain-containing protein n=1 Tax=Flavobacterium sp. TaxID=239 RepID=UPI0039E37906